MLPRIPSRAMAALVVAFLLMMVPGCDDDGTATSTSNDLLLFQASDGTDRELWISPAFLTVVK